MRQGGGGWRSGLGGWYGGEKVEREYEPLLPPCRGETTKGSRRACAMPSQGCVRVLGVQLHRARLSRFCTTLEWIPDSFSQRDVAGARKK